MARVTFLGYDMTDVMRDRIVAAVRGSFPDLTAGLADPLAVRAVVKTWLIDLLATWEGRQAGPEPTVAAKQAADAAVASAKAASGKARLDATDIN